MAAARNPAFGDTLVSQVPRTRGEAPIRRFTDGDKKESLLWAKYYCRFYECNRSSHAMSYGDVDPLIGASTRLGASRIPGAVAIGV